MMKRIPLYFAALAAPSLLLAQVVQEAVLDVGEVHQVVRGFGTGTIQWNRSVEALYERESFRDMYVHELGLNMVRLEVWPSMVLTPTEPEDMDGTTWELGVVGHDPRASHDFAAALYERDPENFKIILSVWSPPGWMKFSGKTSGSDVPESENKLKPDHYRHFARYLAEYIRWFEHHYGVPIYAISPQNEPRFHQNYNSCVYTPAEWAAMVTVLGETMEALGLRPRVRIFGPEHMTSDVSRTIAYIAQIKNNPERARHLDIFAAHGYTDGVQADTNPSSPASLSRFFGVFGGEYWMSETSGENNTWENVPERLGALDGLGAQVHYSLVGGNATAFVHWQITDDAGAQEFALMVMDQKGPKFHVFKHFSSLVDRGAYRVDIAPVDEVDVELSAFMHEQKQRLTIIAMNRRETARSIHLHIAHEAAGEAFTHYQSHSEASWAEREAVVANEDGILEFTLPPRSIATLYAEGVNLSPEGWYNTPGLGMVYTYSTPANWFYQENLGFAYRPIRMENWIYSPALGSWTYAFEAEDGFWLYDFETSDYLYTSPAWGTTFWSVQQGYVVIE